MLSLALWIWYQTNHYRHQRLLEHNAYLQMIINTATNKSLIVEKLGDEAQSMSQKESLTWLKIFSAESIYRERLLKATSSVIYHRGDGVYFILLNTNDMVMDSFVLLN